MIKFAQGPTSRPYQVALVADRPYAWRLHLLLGTLRLGSGSLVQVLKEYSEPEFSHSPCRVDEYLTSI